MPAGAVGVSSVIGQGISLSYIRRTIMRQGRARHEEQEVSQHKNHLQSNNDHSVTHDAQLVDMSIQNICTYNSNGWKENKYKQEDIVTGAHEMNEISTKTR